MLDHAKLARGEGTLPALLRDHARERGGQVALRAKHNGIWKGATWADYDSAARHVALGLTRLGLVRGDRIVIAAEDVPSGSMPTSARK
jgi:long-chain acyl-CoA synthetase